MLIDVRKPLFAGVEMHSSPSPATIRQALEAISDAPLLAALQARRHNGCDTYPVRVLWGVLLLALLLRHPTAEAGRDEWRRNAALRLLIGIESEDAVPHGWNRTRFLAVLGQPEHSKRMRECFDHMVQRLGIAVPDLGVHTAGDTTALKGRHEPNEKRREAEIADGPPQASGGRKEYKDGDGTATKVVEWFGYKLHLLVDVKHEVVLAFDLTDTKAGDNKRIEPLVTQAEKNVPEGRIETLAYDKAADDIQVHQMLGDRDITPVIEVRACWPKDGETENVLGGRIPRHVVHDEAGTVFCYDTTGEVPIRRAMQYAGHEKERGTLTYRCPAKAEGFAYGRGAKCDAGKSYGMTVRVPQEIDRRRFPSIPRNRLQFACRYKGRTAVERVNDRLKVLCGLDDGNAVGSRRFSAHVSAVLLVHLACAALLAKAQRKEGSFGTLRLSPIAKKLEKLTDAERAAPLT